jgi:DsbC/DsbD-like thiol-disulfide interchange protein
MKHLHGLMGVALAVMFFNVMPARAAMTGWAYSDGGRMRIVALSDARDNKVTALLDIEPKPGWKTYWRDPGDAGMPPELDFSGSANLDYHGIAYPVPKADDDDGERYIGYEMPVRMVLTFTRPEPDAASVLDAAAMIGLCKEICLPFQAHFTLPLDVGHAAEQDERRMVAAAEATLPEKPSEGFKVSHSALSSNKSAFTAMIDIPGKDVPVILPVASKGLRFGRPIAIRMADGKAEITIPIKKLPKAPARAEIIMLVKSAGRAMEATLALD